MQADSVECANLMRSGSKLIRIRIGALANEVERRRDASGEVIEQLGRMAIRAGAQASRLRLIAKDKFVNLN